MNLQQRQALRDEVIDGMAIRSWSAARLSRETGLSQTTITRVMQVQGVSPTTVGKIRHAFSEHGIHSRVDFILAAIGVQLRGVPDNELPQVAAALLSVIQSHREGD